MYRAKGWWPALVLWRPGSVRARAGRFLSKRNCCQCLCGPLGFANAATSSPAAPSAFVSDVARPTLMSAGPRPESGAMMENGRRPGPRFSRGLRMHFAYAVVGTGRKWSTTRSRIAEIRRCFGIALIGKRWRSVATAQRRLALMADSETRPESEDDRDEGRTAGVEIG
jgi:hypothetical protein